MKKKLLFMCLVLLTVVMWAGFALADGNTKGVTIHAVDAARIGVELPDGLVADIAKEDGILRIVIDDAASDWGRVLCSGDAYPYVLIRPTVERLNDNVTGHVAFGNDVRPEMEDYIIEWMERDIANYENNHLQWSNGMQVGEVIPDRAMCMPRNEGNPEDELENWPGTIICWLDDSDPAYRYYEKINFVVTHKSDQSFYIPLRFISADTLSPTRDLTVPANAELVTLENGQVTYNVLYQTGDIPFDDQQLQVAMKAPEGAVSAQLAYGRGIYETLTLENGVAYIGGIQYSGISRVDERQYTILWKDIDGNLIDYGFMWVHVVPPENDPWATYVENWHPVPTDRMIINNGAEGCGVDVTYTESTGTVHIGYDNNVSLSSAPGNVAVSVIPPEGAVCYRSNGSGGNVIMGRDDFIASEQHAVVIAQDYRMIDESGLYCIRDNSPFREVHAGPVTVFIQDGAVWQYGGGTNLIYWYASEESAITSPEEPMLVEYVNDTNGVLCRVKRYALVSSEDEITSPVTEVTAVGEYPWNLVVRKYPQLGDDAQHWELQMENETGVYQPLTENMIFYVPYPAGFDRYSACTYEMRHYDEEYNGFALVELRCTDFGLRFEVSSLSPFVMSWEEIQNTKILALPASLKYIGEEAFMGADITGIVLPDGALEIESRAFAGCPNLISINLPATITSISSDAFSGCEMLTATVEEGSYAHKWCADNNVHFKLK